MESACNREQFACTQCGGFGYIHVLTIHELYNEAFNIMHNVHALILSHVCSVCVSLCFCACAVFLECNICTVHGNLSLYLFFFATTLFLAKDPSSPTGILHTELRN